MRDRIFSLLVLAAALAGAVPLLAQGPTVKIEPISCLPVRGNAPVWVSVSPEIPGTVVHIYFRRLNLEVEDWYFLEMRAQGNGRFWAVLPRPTDAKNLRKDLRHGNGRPDDYAWAAWWRAKDASEDRDPTRDLNRDLIREKASIGKLDRRTWIANQSDKAIQDWLSHQTFEPAELIATVVEPSGRVVARSALTVVEVNDRCPVKLSEAEAGVASNLVVGESAPWQKGKEPFHWECDGIVTRIDPKGILRNDTACRSCAVAWWRKPGVVPLLAAGGVVTGIVITEHHPEPSPSRP